ncbi:MAG: hypothetical protein Q4C64_00075 [Erysipelotrichia bacterium]|nr:hypothetical protein [Erysipelotrichia bacterium]
MIAEVKQEIYEKVELGDMAVYQYDEDFYPCELIEKNDNGFEKDGQIFYSMKFKTFDNILLPKQNTIIKITVDKLSGLIVDKNALLQIDDKTYLLSEAYINDFSNIGKYKIPVDVICCTQDEALISGIDLECKNVCILDENLRRILEDD